MSRASGERDSPQLKSVKVTYYVPQDGAHHGAHHVVQYDIVEYRVWPLSLNGAPLQFFCPFPGCDRHPGGKKGGGNRGTINNHGNYKHCKHAKLEEPECNKYGREEPWFKRIEAASSTETR
jgi:hypothetical protein